MSCSLRFKNSDRRLLSTSSRCLLGLSALRSANRRITDDLGFRFRCHRLSPLAAWLPVPFYVHATYADTLLFALAPFVSLVRTSRCPAQALPEFLLPSLVPVISGS